MSESCHERTTAATTPQVDRRPSTVRIRVACTELNLRPATRGVALVVASYFGRDGSWSLPLAELLAATGLKRAAVLSHLRKLREAGIIEGGGSKGHSRYRIGARLRAGGRPASSKAPVQELGPAQSKNSDRTYVSAVRSQDPEGDLSTGRREIARVPKPPPVRAALAPEKQIRRYVVARDQGLPRDEWLLDWRRPEELRTWTRRAVSELITRVEKREDALKAGMARAERQIAQERRESEKYLATIPISVQLRTAEQDDEAVRRAQLDAQVEALGVSRLDRARARVRAAAERVEFEATADWLEYAS